MKSFPTFKDAREAFSRSGVKPSAPGFYNQSAFVKAEARDPRYLENYAAYVMGQEYDDEYVQRAKRVIEHFAQRMYSELVVDGRKGACIDASLVLGQMLERENVWNVALKGALTIVPPSGSSSVTTYFAPIMSLSNPASVGHVWLYAPPFQIVDVTVSQQDYSKLDPALLPKYLLAERGKSASADAIDLMDVDVIQEFRRRRRRMPTMEDVEDIVPGLQRTMEAIGCVEISYVTCALRYFPTGATALDGQLEQAKNLSLNGNNAIDLYDKFRKDAPR